jgi:aflatoxin B1 aldehyde reductase
MATAIMSSAAGSHGVRVIFGTMAIPAPMNVALATDALAAYRRHGFNEIDTAIMYHNGETEKALGQIGVAMPNSGLSVACKVNPWYDLDQGCTTTALCAGLRAESVVQQCNKSLESLKTDSVELLYLHAPDHSTPIEDTLNGLSTLYAEGKFVQWGLSNYAAWQVVDIFHKAKDFNLPTPTTYQGMYNCLTRDVEKELIPALRSLGMRFYAYNPLAGGILSGKHRYEERPSDGRFNSGTIWGKTYQQRFWSKTFFQEVDELKRLCEVHQTCITSASLRWLRLHSLLREDDGVIIGGSSVGHMSQNSDFFADEQALPQDIVDALERAWEACRPTCPKYFR